MTQFYFDIETEGFNPVKDKIITIQYQEVDNKGKPIGRLFILKEWESSEEEIVTKIYNELIGNNWAFIPIGTNLIFDLTFIWAKFKQYNLNCPTLSEYLYIKPLIDLKSSLVMANNLNFRGSGLDQITNKKTDGRDIPLWYNNRNYKKIEDYINDETKCFLEFFQKCIQKLSSIQK